MNVTEFQNTTPHNTDPFDQISVECIFAGPRRSTIRRVYSVTELDRDSLEDIIDDIYSTRKPAFVISELSIVEVTTYADGQRTVITTYDNAVTGDKDTTMSFFMQRTPCLRSRKKGKREA